MTTFRPSMGPRDADTRHTMNHDKESASDLQNTLVEEQLATLETLITEGRTHIDALQQDVADLTIQLQHAQARLGALSGLLLTHERILTTLRASIAPMPAAPPTSAAEKPVEPEAAPAHEPCGESTAGERAAASASAARASTPNARPSKTPAPAESVATPPSVEPREQPAETAPDPGVTTRSHPDEPPAASPPASTPSPVVAKAAAMPSGPPAASQPVKTDGEPSAGGALPQKREPGRVVQRGSKVEIAFDDDTDDDVETYTIVHSAEANPAKNLIAENSPLGSVLLGARPGDVRRFRVGGTGPERSVRVCTII